MPNKCTAHSLTTTLTNVVHTFFHSHLFSILILFYSYYIITNVFYVFVCCKTIQVALTTSPLLQNNFNSILFRLHKKRRDIRRNLTGRVTLLLFLLLFGVFFDHKWIWTYLFTYIWGYKTDFFFTLKVDRKANHQLELKQLCIVHNFSMFFLLL